MLVFPLYSFWHFDDFRWGETRKLDGEEVFRHERIEGALQQCRQRQTELLLFYGDEHDHNEALIRALMKEWVHFIS
jgi:hypothetical protein